MKHPAHFRALLRPTPAKPRERTLADILPRFNLAKGGTVAIDPRQVVDLRQVPARAPIGGGAAWPGCIVVLADGSEIAIASELFYTSRVLRNHKSEIEKFLAVQQPEAAS